MYASGRGSMKVRARWKIEDTARGQWQAVVTELPPGVSSQKVLEEIEELTNPKIKTGKKTLSPEQVALKQVILSVLDTVRDESGKDAPVRLVLEPKSKIRIRPSSCKCCSPIPRWKVRHRSIW
jgi:topoisomerase-4 subunit A